MSRATSGNQKLQGLRPSVYILDDITERPQMNMLQQLNHTLGNVMRRMRSQAPITPLQREIAQHNTAIDAKNTKKLQARARRKAAK